MMSMETSDAMLSGVDDRPYHHGHLRATLLAEAERTLSEDGIEALSLRELARRAGVSHAAPRRHFADRQALLDALAEAGFARLDEEVRAAADEAGPDPQTRLRAVAAAYLRFAVQDAALHELMFTAKNAQPSAALLQAADRLFATLGELIQQGQQAGAMPPGDYVRLCLLLGATLQGIAALAASGRITSAMADALITDELALLARPERLS